MLTSIFFGTKCSWPSKCQWLECHNHWFCLLQKLSIKSNTSSQEFEQYFGPRNKLILKMVGSCCDRGMLNLQIDWYIFMYHTQPMKCDQILSILTEWAYILIHSSLLAQNTEHPFVHQWFIFLYSPYQLFVKIFLFKHFRRHMPQTA